MAYIVQKKYFNGYRCSCCYNSWESTKIVDSLEEALSFVPLENDGDNEFDCVLEKVEIRDGNSGEIIAYGQLSWPQFGGYSGSKATRWYGNRNGTPFDSAESREEWEKTLKQIERQVTEQKIKEREISLQKTQDELSSLRNKLKDLSPEEKEARKPLPPEILANALHGKVHTEVKKVRLAKTIKRGRRPVTQEKTPEDI